jgi:predicted nucleic acid-binding protein
LIADRLVVLIDANVLYPFGVRDALLRFAEAGLFRARWSERILGEWTTALLKKRPKLEKSIESQIQEIHRAFPEALVEGYEYLEASLNLPDDDDGHVLAAAIRSGAQTIVTENLKDFPEDALAPFDIEALTADQFLVSTFDLYPSQAIDALRQMRREYTRPSMNSNDFITHLRRNGLVQLATKLRPDIDAI